jgi:hypothetical protein
MRQVSFRSRHASVVDPEFGEAYPWLLCVDQCRRDKYVHLTFKLSMETDRPLLLSGRSALRLRVLLVRAQDASRRDSSVHRYERLRSGVPSESRSSLSQN